MLRKAIALAGAACLAVLFAAQAQAVVVTFDAADGNPNSYTEAGFTFQSLQDHLHLEDFYGVGTLYNHAGCCSTPYRTTASSGDPFTFNSIDIVHNPDGFSFTGSNGVTVVIGAGVTGEFSFGAAFTNVSFVDWDENNNDSAITSATFSVPEPAPLALLGLSLGAVAWVRRRRFHAPK